MHIVFFFNDTATTEIYTLSLHDALPILQKDLAQSLRLIGQQGSKVFYEGSIARKIAAEMAPHAGALSLQDLKSYKVAEREPLRGTYRGYEIVTMRSEEHTSELQSQSNLVC